MTTWTVAQGRPITLLVEWLLYAGGPAATVTAVTVEIKPAGGGTSVVGPTASGVLNPSTGLNTYTWQVPPALTAGDYLAIWRGTDGDGDQVQATDTVTVTVAPAAATALITVADAKLQLNIPAGDASQDAELAGYIDATTEVIEHIVGPVVPREVVETHDGGTGALVLLRTPVLAITSVVERGTSLASDGWVLTSAGVLYRSTGTWLAGQGAVTVTYQAGRASVPASVKQAAKELIAVNFRSQQGGNFSPFDSGADGADTGGQVLLGFFVPNRVMQLLAPHQQLGGMA